MTTGYITWTWNGKAVRVGFDRVGEASTVLLLPAFSSISTQQKMRPLQERLASEFATVAVDWPGFGTETRPSIAWEPAAYSTFLQHVLTHLAPRLFATVAAGHAARYALSAAATVSGSLGSLCLVAPTWRGPLPTMIPADLGLAPGSPEQVIFRYWVLSSTAST